MTLPVIALVGRPNVGKSTLFNRLTRSRDALVADFPGLTRDRKYGDGVIGDASYIVIDTGGITGDEEGIDHLMAKQSLLAVDEADLVLFLVDARAGMVSSDEAILAHLRKLEKPFHLLVNKCDGLDAEQAATDFSAMGVETPFLISASHGRGVRSMMDILLSPYVSEEEASEVANEEGGSDVCKITMVGRPNVGKSTLVNRLLGEERQVVFDEAGTTRDSVIIPYERDGRQYELVDTAGVRRRGRVSETVEKFSVVNTLQSIKQANVVILMMDAQEGLVDQDLHLLGFALESGRSIVIAVNKWDGLSADHRESVKVELGRRLHFVPWIHVRFISAKHGTGTGELMGDVNRAYTSATKRWSTPKLTRCLEAAMDEHQPPLIGGKRAKLRYAHMGGINPPTVVVHGNRVDKLAKSYVRFLENKFRKAMKLEGTPLKIELRSGENPYEGKKNTLNQRQISRKRRMVQHVKKLEKKRKDKKRR